MGYDNFLTIVLLIYGIVILIIYMVLKKKTKEIKGFNELINVFIDATDELIYLKDENLKYIIVNEALEDFFNKKSTEIIGKDDFELVDKEFSEIQKNTDNLVLEKLTTIKSEIVWKDRTYKINKFPVKLLSGKYGVGAYIEDITDVNNKLKEKNDKLQLILNSTVEGIYGMDLNGNCTFCNESCLKILGYNHEDEIIGKNMHFQIHHSNKDKSPITMDECKIIKSLRKGKGTYVNDEVFWKSDGSCFEVEYNSYPQFKNGEVVGAVVTFTDITEKKKVDEQIRYLSYHDGLTGLYNRLFFEAELIRLNTERNLPISIIMGDANGLKLTNDIFGHSAGDNLLKKVAEAFKKVCRADDIIARIGGDEFVVLLPNTCAEDAKKIMKRIKKEFSAAHTLAISSSISMGSSTKTNVDQHISSIMEEAEEKMYQEKTLNRKNINVNLIKSIINILHEKHPSEAKHSENVSKISEEIGQKMELSNEEIKRLKDAAYFHDIGKIVLSQNLISKKGDLCEKEKKEYRQHSVVGYRILNSFDETLDLAGPVLAHHENWDGSGFPKGLKGQEIPKLARIIAIAEGYDFMTNEMNNNILSKEEAIEEIKKKSGIKYDPEIVDIFVEVMLGANQS